MGLTTALANSLSGLTAAARAADVVSSNVANALTPGYARRELALSSRALGSEGAGVHIDGVLRRQDAAVLADRRLADSAVADNGPRRSFLAAIEQAIGTPDAEGSLTARLARLEAALIAANSRPDSDARLQSVVDSATDVASHLAELTGQVQQARIAADDAIALRVDRLNDALGRIDQLNADILAQRSAGRDASALMDQRQLQIDTVAEIVPVRIVPRDRDQVAIYTTGGAILLEGNPAQIGFLPVGVITADMTLASGALSGLTINGQPVPTGSGGPLSGGSLGAQFALRDELAPRAQDRLDGFARDLYERFADPAADPTLAAGDPGLFTDNGGVFDPLDLAGLAGRITLNALADPAQGGALWRLRDGLGATAAGPVGDGAQIARLVAALAQDRVPVSGGFGAAARSAATLAADLISAQSLDRQRADTATSFAVARQDALTELQLADGVDTDAEMQNLLLIEQAYAANARVVQTIDSLIQQLIGL